MGRLIIDDTTIYELDEECMEQKKREEKNLDAAREKPLKGKASADIHVKERPAP